MHTCDNRKCVNPNHLRLGTQSENMIDCSEKGRCHRAHGKKHYLAKLTHKAVRDIRDHCTVNAQDLHEFADKYGVTSATIHDVVVGNTWKHVR